MELCNKKILFLGDSITEGAGASRTETCYVEVLKQLYGPEVVNYGIGGTRIARQRRPSEIARYDLDFGSRVAEMDPEADVVVVFGGTNDHGHGDAPLGQEDDRTPDTFIGACHCLYASLLEKYPHSRIVILTPLHRAKEHREDGVTLEDYVNHIRRIASQYSLPVLDLFGTSAIRADIPEIAQQLTVDGLHPNDTGHAILATEIGEYLQTL